MGGEAKQTCIIVPEKALRGWPPDDAALGCFGAVACRSLSQSSLVSFFNLSCRVTCHQFIALGRTTTCLSPGWGIHLSVSNFSFPSPDAPIPNVSATTINRL
jgi:hypothetical protein